MSTKGSKSGVGKLEKLSETANRSEQSPSTQFAFTSPGVDSKTFRPGSMKGSPSTGRMMMKSASLGTIGLEDRQESYIVDQADIIDLTQDVKNFSDNLARLKAVINENLDQEENIRVVAHERLGDVLRILKNVLQRYPPLNSTELFSAAGALITKIKNFNYEDGQEGMEHTFLDAIDQLALAFSSSVSEYLMGDLQHGLEEEVRTKSYDNLLAVSHSNETIHEKDEESVSHLTVEQMDEILIGLQAGLDLALQRAKAWSKYLKDLMIYIERRAQFELEYAKNLARLAATTNPILTEEGYLPLQSVYCTVLSQDIEYAKTCHATLALLQSSKFIEPLTARKMEHDKMRKAVKETWMKEVKKMQETVNNQRKAHSMYVSRQQEYEKAKELAQKVESDKLQSSMSGSQQSITSSKVDKRKKSEEEAAHKAAESETTYKACIAEANNRQQELQKTKSQILATIREQICHCDETIKKVTIDYFQLLQTVSSAVPIQYSTLCEATKCYEPGSQYREFVRNIPLAVAQSDVQEPFKFESYSQSVREIDGRKVSGDSNTSEPSGSCEGSPQISQRKDKYPTPAWSLVGNETDSASGSSKSLDSSPSNSPFTEGRKNLTISGSVEDLVSDISSDVKHLLAVPGTFDPDVQGILKHQGKRRNTTFGVDFQEQVEQFHMAVPPIITKCLKEVERRGICLKGIYRVSGVKSRVESLCQKFENDPNSVDLLDENPNVISNVLKLYLRQLPEPLLTFRLYPDFIQLAKENMTCSPSREQVTKRLQILVDGLPFSNRKTCAVLMHHLQKVASYSDQNQMNASNLGIVFGPTLLRPQGGNASLACLVDTPHQTRVVELLIVSAQILFGPSDDHEVLHGETLVEELPNEAISRDQRLPSSDASEPRATSESLKKSSIGSVSPTEKVPIYLPVVPIANLKDTNKLSPSEDFQLPGSTESDKKNSSAASTVTQSSLKALSTDGDESGESDLNSDDDLPDTLLPDDSQFTHMDLETILEQGAEAICRPQEPEFITTV